MKTKQREKAYKRLAGMTDEEIERKYYDILFYTLGSEAEQMYEFGYDIADIKEQEKYEKYLSEYCDLIEECCKKRNIKLLGEENE